MKCGCGDLVSPGLMDLFDARATMIKTAVAVRETEFCLLSDAAGRVLAEPALATLDMPGVDNSAMDGYALRLADLTAATEQAQDKVGLECEAGLEIVQRIPAGAGIQQLAEGGCARIFTGAPVPQGTDAVVPQERVRIDEAGRVHIEGKVERGANIRRRGEESRAGDVVLEAGTRLNAAAIALLASHGLAELTVYRRLNVALVSTGDELIAPGQDCLPGQIYNSNAAMLRVLLQQQGCHIIDFGVVEDRKDAVSQCFTQARDDADLVICSGGVSVGEEDHVRPVLEQLGGTVFHGVAMKPGKPFVLGYLGESAANGTPLIGLPGNPVASLIGWQLLALPFVQGCQGRTPSALQRFLVTAGFSKRASKGRRELLRVVLDWSQDTPVALLAGGQGSHMLSSASQAHGYLIIDADAEVEKDHAYEYCPGAQFID